MSFRRERGFTIIELIVVMVIVAVVTTLGVISIASRWRTSKLESAAQQMLSTLSAARTASIYKNCPTRIIFCADAACSSAQARNASLLSDASGPYIAVDGVPARFYAVLRMAYYGVNNNQRSCWFAGADPSPGLMHGWDFDSKPAALPLEVRVQPIYSNLDQFNEEPWMADAAVPLDDSGRTSNAAINSLWFPSSADGLTASATMRPQVPANIPATNSAMPGGRFAMLQLKLDNCNPDEDADCLAYIIAAGAGGRMELVACTAGTAGARPNDSNDCY
jgi:prepilin-type N-terminal cleavage/methylation domain-containing protein